MKKTALTITLVSLILFSLVAGILLVDLAGDEEAVGKLYRCPVSVGENTYVINVRTNWTSTPEVSYFGLLKSVSVDFRGSERATVFCNITIPADLIWGELCVIWKHYLISDDWCTMSNNGTHHFVHFTYNHTALVEHFTVRGTEGITELPSS